MLANAHLGILNRRESFRPSERGDHILSGYRPVCASNGTNPIGSCPLEGLHPYHLTIRTRSSIVMRGFETKLIQPNVDFQEVCVLVTIDDPKSIDRNTIHVDQSLISLPFSATLLIWAIH